jgi:16S rRNA (guanine527-N7)-methyltransferase
MGGKTDVLSQLDVSRETIERLDAFVHLVEKWNSAINLVSRSSIKDIWRRHIADSVQVFRAAPNAVSWVDLGPGGGFPGLVAALVAMDEMPDLRVTLIESDQRKSTFLRTAIREIGANATVLTERMESAPRQNADILSARALAESTILLGHAQRHLRKDGIALFPKGITWKKELREARKHWQFDVEPVKSITEAGAVVLRIRNIERV